MSGRNGADRRAPLTDKDLAIATLVGRYAERRERGGSPCADDLLAVAAELGESALDERRIVLACYEAMRAWGANQPQLSPRKRDPQTSAPAPL